MDKSWKTSVFEVVLSLGGKSVGLQDIYREIRKRPLVSDYHKEPWKTGGQPRYECWMRRVLTELVREKKLIWESSGVYSAR